MMDHVKTSNLGEKAADGLSVVLSVSYGSGPADMENWISPHERDSLISL